MQKYSWPNFAFGFPREIDISVLDFTKNAAFCRDFFQGWVLAANPPRVARSSQPWAVVQNPGGIPPCWLPALLLWRCSCSKRFGCAPLFALFVFFCGKALWPACI